MCSKDKKISVVIVTYNSERDIFDCIECIRRFNTIGEGLELIVVDNNSASFEPIAKQLRELYPDIVLIENKKNGGYGQGNNLGIAAAHAPIIAIVNPDVRWTMPLIEPILQLFEDPQTALVGCRQMNDEHHPASAIHFAPHASGFEKSIGEMIVNRLGIYCPHRMYLSGACFFVRKSVMEQIGGFDEKIFLYAEENDIRYRILALKNGYKIRYVHHLSYLHPCHNRAWNEQTEKIRIQSDLYVLSKQGVQAASYFRSERARCKWNIFLYRLSGNKNGIARQKQLIQLYEP